MNYSTHQPVQVSTLQHVLKRPELSGYHRDPLHTPVLQETLENVLIATIVLTGTLVVLEVTSVT